MALKFLLRMDGREIAVEVNLGDEITVNALSARVPVSNVQSAPGRVEMEIAKQHVVVEGKRTDPGDAGEESWALAIDGERCPLSVHSLGGERDVPRVSPRQEPERPAPSHGAQGDGIAITPPMPGRILEVSVRDGDVVEKGAPLVILEAMKMKNEIASPVRGVVRAVGVSPGKNVKAHEVMLRVVPS